MSAALLTVDITDYERTGYVEGLSAGLAEALVGIDIETAAPGWFVAVPVDLAGNAPTMGHSMARDEDIAILRLPAAGSCPSALVGLRLAAVRIGVTRQLLDLAIEHLTGRTGGGEPLIRKQLNQGAIAEILAALEMLRRYLETTVLSPTADAIVDIHDQLTTLDWEITKLFGAAGFMADHPVRALYVAGLVANTWVCKGEFS
jgi:hypothetical protein